MIKKIFLIVSLFLMSLNLSVFAFDTSYCPSKPYPVSSGIPKFFSNVTGTNLLLTSVAEHQIKSSLKKQLHGSHRITVKAFGGRDFLNGKFESLTIKSKNIYVDGVYVSNFEAQTLCGYNHISLENNNIYTNENMLLSFKSQITENDLKNTVMSDIFQKKMSNLNISMSGLVIFKVIDPQINIVNNRLKYTFKVISPLIVWGQPIKVSLEASPKIENGKIKFSDICVKSKSKKINLDNLMPILNVINPFVQEFNISKATKANLKVNHVYIENNILNVQGIIFIPKNHIAK